MTQKRTNKLLALLLAVLMVMSLLPVTALAAEDNITIVIDLSGYNGTITGGFSSNWTNDNNGSLIAGQINTFSCNSFNSGNLTANFTLEDFEPASYDAWTISGSMANGNDPQSNIQKDPDNETLSFLRYPNGTEPNAVAISIKGNSFVFNSVKQSALKKCWPYGTTLVFTPVFAASGGYTATAKSINDDYGSATATPTSTENQYTLEATPNAGYSFNYWLKDAAEDTAENRITENPYTVTLDADATFTAYFRERYTLTAKSEDAEKGSAAAEYLGAADGKDSYCLTAMPTDYYLFDKWTCGDDEYTDNPLDVAVAKSGISYTAHFKPVELTISDEAALRPVDSVRNGFGGASSLYEKIVSAGCRSALVIPVTVPKDLANVTVSMRLTDSEGQELAQHSVTRDIGKNFSSIVFTLDPTPEDVSNLTAEITLTTPAGSNTVTKTYTGLSVAASENNNDFRFVTSPAEAYTYKTIIQAGANLRGVYGRTDAVTKALSLYAYGPAGVYAWAQGKETDFALLGSIPTGNSKEVLALGPNGEKGLTAVVGDTTLQLYTWDGTSWTSVSGSALSADQYGLGTKVTLVMDADDVWTDTRHWNGTAWESQSYAFAAFERVSDTEAYGVDENGKRWRYDGTDWTAAEAVSAPEIASVTSFSPNGYKVALGQDQHGDWYLFVQARFHFIDDSGFYGYNGSNVYKWNGEKWVYQIMTDFNDPDDDLTETKHRIRPDGVQTISSPAPGVSVMYGNGGANGAIYLSTDNVTITFNPGEGTLDNAALAKLTAPILSEIDSAKIPGATRNNYVFGGWYYDEACTVEFDAGSTAMPGEDITLHAKWTERDGLSDELAFYRQRALNALAQQLGKFSEADYSEASWAALQKAYNDGVAAINAATAGTEKVDENIDAALNAAVEAMRAIPKLDKPRTSYITVAVSMDANTLGLGYLIEPTLVTVEEGTSASKVITDLLAQTAREKYGVTSGGYTTYHESEPAAQYPWMMTGSVDSDFYLAQVYYPEQQGYKLPAFIENAIGGISFNASDANGNYLGEFDYLTTSGWTYSIGDKTGGNAQFPGVGASGWSLSDGEVMRWQFTLMGYGSDLNADNTQWGAQSLIPTLGDKSALTWKVAEINDAGTKDSYGDDYDKAVKVLTDAEATQKQVDDALAALNKQDSGNASSGGTGKKDKTYQITVAATENGTATVSASTAGEGEKITVTAKPAEGYELDSITVKGEKAGSVAVTDGAFTMPADDVTVTVKFKKAEGKKTTAERPFTDVNEGDWFYDAVYYCFDKGYFKGTSETGFEPQGTMTRAMFATVLWRIAGQPAAKGGKSFSDVEAGQWYADAVAWASENGIVNGTDAGFEPDAPVTREQIATMLYRFVQHMGVDVSARKALDGFGDGTSTSPWAKEAMEWAAGVGLFQGDDNGKLNPGGEATRAEVATLVERLIGLMEK